MTSSFKFFSLSFEYFMFHYQPCMHIKKFKILYNHIDYFAWNQWYKILSVSSFTFHPTNHNFAGTYQISSY